MNQDIPLPDLDTDAQEITFATWVKQLGDSLNVGDVIAEVVTDKANIEIETPVAGTLAATLVEEGETVVVGQIIARVDLAP